MYVPDWTWCFIRLFSYAHFHRLHNCTHPFVVLWLLFTFCIDCEQFHSIAVFNIYKYRCHLRVWIRFFFFIFVSENLTFILSFSHLCLRNIRKFPMRNEQRHSWYKAAEWTNTKKEETYGKEKSNNSKCLSTCKTGMHLPEAQIGSKVTRKVWEANGSRAEKRWLKPNVAFVLCNIFSGFLMSPLIVLLFFFAFVAAAPHPPSSPLTKFPIYWIVVDFGAVHVYFFLVLTFSGRWITSNLMCRNVRA